MCLTARLSLGYLHNAPFLQREALLSRGQTRDQNHPLLQRGILNRDPDPVLANDVKSRRHMAKMGGTLRLLMQQKYPCRGCLSNGSMM